MRMATRKRGRDGWQPQDGPHVRKLAASCRADTPPPRTDRSFLKRSGHMAPKPRTQMATAALNTSAPDAHQRQVRSSGVRSVPKTDTPQQETESRVAAGGAQSTQLPGPTRPAEDPSASRTQTSTTSLFGQRTWTGSGRRVLVSNGRCRGVRAHKAHKPQREEESSRKSKGPK